VAVLRWTATDKIDEFIRLVVASLTP